MQRTRTNMNTLLQILLFLLIMDATVAAASRRIHLRGSKRTKSNKLAEPQDRTVEAAEEDSICEDVDLELVGTNWNLTNFTWSGVYPGVGETTLLPVDLTRERRGMTLLIGKTGTSGTCGNNLCWGVSEMIADNVFWIHSLARTKMMSTPQEEAYAALLTNGPYVYSTCVDSSTNQTKLNLFEVVDRDEDGNLIQGRLMAIYDQIPMLFGKLLL